MAPIPEPQVPAPFDSDDEESLLLLADVERKCYASTRKQLQRCTISEEEEDTEQQQRRDSSNDSLLLRMWKIYFRGVQRWPLVVKSITAFILMMLADFLAQMVEHVRNISSDDDGSFLNLPRMLHFGVFGLFGAPWTHYYYDWLDRTLPPTPQPWTWTTAVKVVIDQGIQAPLLLVLIISGLALMDGRGINGVKSDMEKDYIYSLIQNWKLWIPATILNIAFIKPALRVLYDNLIFLVWTIYLSIILNEGKLPA